MRFKIFVDIDVSHLFSFVGTSSFRCMLGSSSGWRWPRRACARTFSGNTILECIVAKSGSSGSEPDRVPEIDDVILVLLLHFKRINILDNSFWSNWAFSANKVLTLWNWYQHLQISFLCHRVHKNQIFITKFCLTNTMTF